MESAEIYERLTPIFQDVFDRDDLVPHAALSAADVEEWDSLSHIRLVVAIEQALNIRFTIGELSSLKNVGQMVDLIRGKL
ncbi:MAG: acyl carrier protein [Magnetospirillum sp. WYHS-4]